jgi:phosphoadenosine phosphosulfate reductase
MSELNPKLEIPRAFLEEARPEPREILAWALEHFRPHVLMTTAFGLHGVALIHMVQELEPELPILFIDTGYHFPETLETKRRVVERYGLHLIEYHAPPPEVEAEAVRSGRASIIEDPELCCTERKVKVFQRALEELKPRCLISARSRHQSETRRELALIEPEAIPVRVNPLVDWSLDEAERYVRKHGIPYNPLHDKGYRSIGCWPCTRPVEEGEDIRAGRWSGLDKKECGIWTTGEEIIRTSCPPEPEEPETTK